MVFVLVTTLLRVVLAQIVSIYTGAVCVDRRAMELTSTNCYPISLTLLFIVIMLKWRISRHLHYRFY